jgi:hypothetical protein
MVSLYFGQLETVITVYITAGIMRAIYVTYLLIILREFEDPGHNIRCIGTMS